MLNKLRRRASLVPKGLLCLTDKIYATDYGTQNKLKRSNTFTNCALKHAASDTVCPAARLHKWYIVLLQSNVPWSADHERVYIISAAGCIDFPIHSLVERYIS